MDKQQKNKQQKNKQQENKPQENNQQEDKQQIEKKQRNKKRLILILVLIAVLAVGVYLIIDAQYYAVRTEFRNESVTFLNDVTESIEKREHDLELLDAYNKSVSADLIYNISYIYDDIDFPNLNWKQREKLKPKNVCNMDEFNLESLYIIGADGTIWISDDDSLIKKNIVEEGILTADNLDFFNSDGLGTYKRSIDENGEVQYTVEPVAGYSNGHKVRYYAVEVYGANPDEKYYAVGADINDLGTQIVQAYSDLGAYFDPIVDYDGFSAFAINADTGIIEYTSSTDAELQSRLAQDVGLEGVNAMEDGQFHNIKIDGKDRTIYVKTHYSDTIGNYIIVAADIGVDGPLRSAVFACIVVMIITTCLLLNAGYKLVTERRKHLIKEYTACVVACIVLVGVVCFYISTISAISQAMNQCDVNAQAFSKYYASGRENAANMSEFYKTKKVSVLKSIAIYLEQNQGYLMDADEGKVYEYYDKDEDGNKEYILDSNGNVTKSIADSVILREIADDEDYKDLYLVNSQGNTVITSSDNWYFTINNGKSGYDEEFNQVLERKSKDFYDYVKKEDCGSEVVAVPYEMYVSTDGEGNTIYHNTDEYLKDTTGTIRPEYGLLVALSENTSDLRLSMESIPREMLNSMRVAEGAELILTQETDDGHKFTLSSDGIRESDFEEMALPDSYYLSNNYKTVNVSDIDRMIGISCLSGVKDMNLITVLNDSDIQTQRLPIVIASVMAVILAGIVLIIYFVRLTKNKKHDDERLHDERLHDIEDLIEDLDEEQEEKNTGLGWLRTSGILGLAALIILMIVFMFINGNGYLRFIAYVITTKWEKGIHIFSVSYFIYMIIVVMVIIAIAREFVYLLAPVLNARAETMLRLLLSLVQYGCIIACIFYTLYLFGFQMGTVVTGASIMTIVIGLGANSLIGDILAGLFIIFEHEYQVGNWITIDDFTGVVREIGLRTTKVENSSGNIKTFNNSKISEVLNLTDNYTSSAFSIYINNAVPLKKVSGLVRNELSRRVRYCKEIVDGPFPEGMQDNTYFVPGYYIYMISARCEQKDVDRVRDVMFSEFIEILKKEGIDFR